MKTTIADIELEHPIFNASGPRCTTAEELHDLGESNAAAIMIKSMTAEPRGGNPEPRYVDLDLGSINSMGLPNLGYKRYLEMIPELKKHGKPLFASVSGLCCDDNIEIVKALNETGIDAIELNLSCPNVPGKPQMGYDFEQSDEVIGKVKDVCQKPLGLKLPPYFDFVHFEMMAKVLNKHKPDFITCINSVGNGLFIDVEKEQVVIKPKGGFGGIGGEYVKPTALANVHKFYELLDPSIDIIGVGGIVKGSDVFEYVLAGAKAVQIGTTYQKENVACFDRLEKEFNEIMERKGYSSIEEARGRLKTL